MLLTTLLFSGRRRKESSNKKENLVEHPPRHGTLTTGFCVLSKGSKNLMESIEKRGDGELIGNLVGLAGRHFVLFLLLSLLFVDQRELQQHFKADAGKFFAQLRTCFAIYCTKKETIDRGIWHRRTKNAGNYDYPVGRNEWTPCSIAPLFSKWNAADRK